MISALDAQKRAFGVEIEGLEQENQAENLKNFCSENNYWDIAELFSISLKSSGKTMVGTLTGMKFRWMWKCMRWRCMITMRYRALSE